MNQALCQRIGDSQEIARVRLNVRIARSMDITLAAIEMRGNFQHSYKAGRFKIACAARCDGAVGRFAQDHRQPGHFQFGAGTDQQVCAACVCDQAGTRFHAVRVLQGICRRINAGFVAGEQLRERRPFRFTGEHVEYRMSGGADQ